MSGLKVRNLGGKRRVYVLEILKCLSGRTDVLLADRTMSLCSWRVVGSWKILNLDSKSSQYHHSSHLDIIPRPRYPGLECIQTPRAHEMPPFNLSKNLSLPKTSPFPKSSQEVCQSWTREPHIQRDSQNPKDLARQRKNPGVVDTTFPCSPSKIQVTQNSPSESRTFPRIVQRL